MQRGPVSSRSSNLKVDCIDANPNQAMREMVQPLHSVGHRRIRIAWRSFSDAVRWVGARYAGYFRAMHDLRLGFDPHLVLEPAPERPMHVQEWIMLRIFQEAASISGESGLVLAEDFYRLRSMGSHALLAAHQMVRL